MANLGYAISQGLAGGANAIGILADQTLKEQEQVRAEERAANRQLDVATRIAAANEMMRQRAKEWDQAQAASRAKQIDEGIISNVPGNTASATYEVDGEAGESSATGDKTAVQYTDSERARARVKVAEKLGFLDEAKEGRAALDTERRFEADKARDENTKAHNERMAKIAEDRAERDERLAKLAADRTSAREDATDRRERRAATAKALDSVNANIKTMEKEVADLTLPDDLRKKARDELAGLRAEEKKLRGLLTDAGIESSAPQRGGNIPSLAEILSGNPAQKAVPAAPAAPANPAESPTPARKSGSLLERLRAADPTLTTDDLDTLAARGVGLTDDDRKIIAGLRTIAKKPEPFWNGRGFGTAR